VVRVGYAPAVLVADLRHFLELPGDTPAPARRLAEQLRDIVRATTAGEAGAAWVSALPCRRRPGNRRCPGRILLRRNESPATITWECTACGDAGVVSGWQDTPYDLSHRSTMSSGPAEDIGISDDTVASLRETMLLDAECERVVYRGRANRGQIVLTATDEQLDELLGYLAAEANHETNRRRQQRLDTAYDELSDAAHGSVRHAVTSPGSSGAPLGMSAAAAARRPTPASTGLPDLDVARVQRWCAARVPGRARHQVRVECQLATRHLTIVERRAPRQDDTRSDWTSFPIARLRYAETAKTWTLYWRDRNLRFHVYDRLPSPHVDDLLTEIDCDPTCIFWG